MIWNFTNGWQKTSFTLASVIFMLGLSLNTVFADEGNNSGQNGLQTEFPSLELLEMLGQFDTKDEQWFENEMNNEIQKPAERNTDETINE